MQLLDSRSSNKHVALQNLSVCYKLKNIRQHFRNNELKILNLAWNDEFELAEGYYSVSDIDIQDYIKYTIKNMEHYSIMPLFI